jgi:hypothetical protein
MGKLYGKKRRKEQGGRVGRWAQKSDTTRGGVALGKSRFCLEQRLLSVAADGFYRAASEGFFTEGALVIRLRLLVEEGVATIIITLEVGWRCLTAQVAIDALVIDIVGTFYVLRVFVGNISHGFGSRNEGLSEGTRMLIPMPVCAMVFSPGGGSL